MKLLFKGWKREVRDHDHDVIPVKHLASSYEPGEVGDPIEWTDSLQAFGKLEGLALSGSFLVQFSLEQAELRNWLSKFVRAKPEAAVRLLAEMQGEAVLALAKRTEERAAEGSSLPTVTIEESTAAG